MKKLILALSLALSTFAGASTIRQLDVTAVELVNVLSHCLPQYEDALKDADRVAKIEFVSPRPTRGGTQVDTWNFTLTTGGYPPGPPASVVSVFEVKRTTYPIPPGLQDGGPRVNYACENHKN